MRFLLIPILAFAIGPTVFAGDSITAEEYGLFANQKMEVFEFDAAVEYFTKAIQLEPGNSRWFAQRANAYYVLGDYSIAKNDCATAISLNPQSSIAYEIRGMIKLIQQDKKGAESDFSKSLQIEPTNPQLYFNRGEIYYSWGDKARACADWVLAKEQGFSGLDEILEEHCP